LIDALARDYHERYGPNEEMSRYPPAEFAPPDRPPAVAGVREALMTPVTPGTLSRPPDLSRTDSMIT
jgi:hypothetical protein